MVTDTEERFNVVHFFDNGTYEYSVRNVSIDEAVDRARWSIMVAKALSDLSPLVKVIITDMLDCTCFEWNRVQGVVFPSKDELLKMSEENTH